MISDEAHAGDLYWLFNAAVTTPVPLFPETIPVQSYVHFFGTAGNCVKHKDWKMMFIVGDSRLREVGIRSTIGAGLVFTWAQFLPVRIEFNCSVPLLRSPHDPVEKKYFHVNVCTAFS